MHSFFVYIEKKNAVLVTCGPTYEWHLSSTAGFELPIRLNFSFTTQLYYNSYI